METGRAAWLIIGSQLGAVQESRLDGLKKTRFPFKFASGALLFCVLTLCVFYYQFSRMSEGEAAFSWPRLHFEYLLLLLLCLPFDTFASSLRIWLVCRVLKRDAGLWTCLKAEWANVGVAMLTPSQTGGGFGQIYILSRSGISISTATIISLITFLGTMVGLLCIGLYSVLISGAKLGSCFSLAVWPLTIVLGLMALPLLRPSLFRSAVLEILRGLFAMYRFVYVFLFRRSDRPRIRLSKLENLGQRLIDLAYRYHGEAWQFIRKGRLHFFGICLLSLVFLTARCFMAFFSLRFLGAETSSLGEVLEIQMALLFLLYFAPTPGSSGLAELFSFSAMAAIIPPGLGAYYNFLWRTATLYLPAMLGLVSLALALLRDTGRVFRRKAPIPRLSSSSEDTVQTSLRGNDLPAALLRQAGTTEAISQDTAAKEMPLPRGFHRACIDGKEF